jgi:hypothetical protein
MKFYSIATFVSLVAASTCAGNGITLGPVRGQPGESVRLVTHSETPGGTIERTSAGKTRKGSIAITRDRELIWTFRQPTADGTKRGMVRVPKITTTTVVKIDGNEEKSTDDSPLTGKLFAMTKAPAGDWKFELDGSVPMSRVEHEIDHLSAYLKRDWYPNREINVGDSWEFDPTWVKLIIEKDLTHAQTIGTMRLRQVRRAQSREVAVIDISIQSSGADYKSDGSESSASIDLKGQVIINLATMLDEELDLTGTVTTSTRKPGESVRFTLPVRLSTTKSFVRDQPLR